MALSGRPDFNVRASQRIPGDYHIRDADPHVRLDPVFGCARWDHPEVRDARYAAPPQHHRSSHRLWQARSERRRAFRDRF
jgi:hypothetical protein